MTTEAAVTLAVALLGAITGTVSLGWTIYRDVIYKGRLKLLVQLLTTDDENEPNTLRLVFTNNGKTSILLTTIGTLDSGGPYEYFPCDALPKRMEPGDFLVHHLDLPSNFHNIQNICGWDSLGQAHRANVADLRKLQNMVPVSAAKRTTRIQEERRKIYTSRN